MNPVLTLLLHFGLGLGLTHGLLVHLGPVYGACNL